MGEGLGKKIYVANGKATCKGILMVSEIFCIFITVMDRDLKYMKIVYKFICVYK
jgi:hypothetical protein